jgi:hypothetical protein
MGGIMFRNVYYNTELKKLIVGKKSFKTIEEAKEAKHTFPLIYQIDAKDVPTADKTLTINFNGKVEFKKTDGS